MVLYEGDHLAEAGAELALNALTGRERAQAIEHLQHCLRCRAELGAMAVTGDDLLRLLPDTPLPPGFTNRVTSQLRQSNRYPAGPRSRNRTRAALAASAVAVTLITGGLAGWGLRAGAGPSSSARAAAPALRTAALIAPTHQRLGKVFLHLHGPNWLFFTVDADGGNITLICQLTTQTGHLITAGTFALQSGDGYWGTPVPAHPTTITGARLITTSGTLLATAHFTIP